MSAFKDWLNGLTSKSTPVDADVTYLRDSEASGASKKLTLSNLWLYIKGKADTVYSTFSGSYNDLADKPTLGSAAALDTGTSAGNVVVLDGSAKLPAVDGSQLTNLPSGGGSPGGSGTELQYRSGASSFGAVTGSSVDGGSLTLAGTVAATTVTSSGNVIAGASSGHAFSDYANTGLFCTLPSIWALKTNNSVNLNTSHAHSTRIWCRGIDMSAEYYIGPNATLTAPVTDQFHITDGTAGTFRDLKLRNLIATGNLATGIASKTASYTATANDGTIECDATSGAITITLPAASGIAGRIYVIKKTDSSGNAVTVDANASETIDGATTVSLASQYSTVVIQCNAAGTAWIKLASI